MSSPPFEPPVPPTPLSRVASVPGSTGVERVDGPHGSAVLTVRTPGVLVIALRGVTCDQVAAAACDASERCLKQSGGGCQLFFDASGLTGYTPEFRQRWTSWFIAHRKELQRVVVFSESRVVQMGVTVANAALGGFLTATTRRSEFEALLSQAERGPS